MKFKRVLFPMVAFTALIFPTSLSPADKLLALGSKEYEGGKHMSSEQLKEGLQQRFAGDSK